MRFKQDIIPTLLLLTLFSILIYKSVFSFLFLSLQMVFFYLNWPAKLFSHEVAEVQTHLKPV